MRKLVHAVFWVSLAGLLLFGGLVVFGQILGTIVQNADLVVAAGDIFSAPAFIMSTVCALAALCLQYLRPNGASEPDA